MSGGLKGDQPYSYDDLSGEEAIRDLSKRSVMTVPEGCEPAPREYIFEPLWCIKHNRHLRACCLDQTTRQESSTSPSSEEKAER